jgi:[ribosomal protein S5]-alanine N-acetyltransferase
MRTLLTQRLVLEPQRLVHADEMFVVLSDPALYRYENAPPESCEAVRRRFTKLESRSSPEGDETWLNWVVRLRDGPLLGFVQATVTLPDRARIAYVFGSSFWGRGYAREATRAMIAELQSFYDVTHCDAVFKRTNWPSRKLLVDLGFVESPAAGSQDASGVEADEDVMYLPGVL